MPKLRHIAIAAEDPEKMADFYKKAFKFKTDQLGKGLDYRGIHHFGVLVEDVDEFSRRLESLGAEHYVDRNQIDPQAGYFEKKFYGPERVLFDIAEHAWAGAEPLPAQVQEAAE